MAVVASGQDHGPRTKPFLGGWRNTVTGLIYRNACTQTYGKTMKSRNTQTIAVMDAITDVVHDREIQVQFLPDIRDIFVTPGLSSFVMTATEKVQLLSHPDNNRILDSVLTIQRCYRSYRTRVTASANVLEAVNVSRNIDEDKIKRTDDSQTLSAYRRTDFVIVNRNPPQTSSDFELLHNLLDRWRILETERASCTLLGSSKVAACGLILSKEVEMLRATDSMKTAVRVKCEERKRCRVLDQLARPVTWQDNQGRPILVDTLRVQRARQHRNVYASLANEDLSVPERVNLLRGLRRLAIMHTCSHSLELVYLVDQELDLLKCRVDTTKLNWLRNRLKLSYLKLARNALQGELEEDVSRFGWTNASITRLCRNCGKLLSLEKFPRQWRLRASSCIYCTSMRTRRGPRVVYEPYERMLQEIRRFEARMGCYGSLAFVIESKVVYRLVNEVWHGKSGISECDDLDELRLTRFRREFDWAPWNSLLLTKTEAAIHHSITHMECFYDSTILQMFNMKNLQAKIYFESICDVRGNMVTPSLTTNK